MDPLAERLRTARERQGKTLRQLSTETKIREPFLEALESGRYNVLPAVYVKSFIRTAGAAVGIPSREIAALMNEVFDTDDEDASHLPPTQPPTPKEPPQRSLGMNLANRFGGGISASRTPQEPDAKKLPLATEPRIPVDRAEDAPTDARRNVLVNPTRVTPPIHAAARLPLGTSTLDRLVSKVSEAFARRPASLRSPLVLSMLILAVIAAVVLIWSIFLRSDPEPTQAAGQGADSVVDVDANQALGSGGPTPGGIAATDSMVLTASVADTAWVNITSDDKRSQQVVVLPGGEYRWSAMQKFVLSVSNAGAVTFARNGETLKPFGKSGEVVRSVTITRKEVRSSATVTRPQPKPAAPAPRPIITPAPQQRVDPNKRKPEAIQRR